jgi:hypothetical protein
MDFEQLVRAKVGCAGQFCNGPTTRELEDGRQPEYVSRRASRQTDSSTDCRPRARNRNVCDALHLEWQAGAFPAFLIKDGEGFAHGVLGHF